MPMAPSRLVWGSSGGSLSRGTSRSLTVVSLVPIAAKAKHLPARTLRLARLFRGDLAFLHSKVAVDESLELTEERGGVARFHDGTERAGQLHRRSELAPVLSLMKDHREPARQTSLLQERGEVGPTHGGHRQIEQHDVDVVLRDPLRRAERLRSR